MYAFSERLNLSCCHENSADEFVRRTGTWIATTDMYLVRENFEGDVPLGFLLRDHDDWMASNQKMHALQRRTKAKMLFGHDAETLAQYELAPHAYD